MVLSCLLSHSRINEASAISLEERLQQLETKLDAEIRHNDVLTKKLEELSENCVTKNDLNSLSKVPRQGTAYFFKF